MTENKTPIAIINFYDLLYYLWIGYQLIENDNIRFLQSILYPDVRPVFDVLFKLPIDESAIYRHPKLNFSCQIVRFRLPSDREANGWRCYRLKVIKK